MNIFLNGTSRTFPDNPTPGLTPEKLTIDLLLQKQGLEPASIVVELNSEIVPRQEFASRSLSDGDHLEVLHFVGGG